MKVSAAGEFLNARRLFQAVAAEAGKRQLCYQAAMNWNNAGACSLLLMQYVPALQDFMQAKKIAESAGLSKPLANTLNNLAALYLHIGQPANALQVSVEGLRVAANYPEARAKLRFQAANALSQLGRIDESEPVYRLSISELMDQLDLRSAARELGLFGNELVRANRLGEAESALSEALRLTRIHRFDAVGNILRGLANLRSAQGDPQAAASLFDAALAAPPALTPRWGIYMDRGHFRLKYGMLEPAFADFREARRLALKVRADMVPADQDRVELQDGLSGLMEGFVNAGNRLSIQGDNDPKLLSETFDAAEQDRLWNLRALVPGPDDWRTRLPDSYWELLANYRAAERSAIGARSAAGESKSAAIALQLRQMELVAAGPDTQLATDGTPALVHVRRMLGSDSVLLSFHLSETSCWLWAVDRNHTGVYALPPLATLTRQVAEFSGALRSGADASALGRALYEELFGHVAASSLAHKRWLIEPDGPLHQLPFAALVTGRNRAGAPEYLIERSELQLIPGALLLQRGSLRASRGFLGVGDPVYNAADPRFNSGRLPELALSRLPNTTRELEACARQWTSGQTKLLTGADANLEELEAELKSSPSVIHFATHVVASTDASHSGLIALSLNPNGAMGLLGPKEILTRSVSGSLVVMDGCYSSQGKAVASAGLMGLTRAWIEAGATAVIATQWDIPDNEAQSLMTAFYRALNKSAGTAPAAALQQAQLQELNSAKGRYSPAAWAGYFLLSRI